jgi:hypothetical protein
MKKYDKEPNPVKSQAFINTKKKKKGQNPQFIAAEETERGKVSALKP